jgi:hypothetical protein
MIFNILHPFHTIALVGFALTASAQDSLETGFRSPPDSAKPQTWWHWMNGNITKAGITADLEAMKQIGLGGATVVSVDSGVPPGPVLFMSLEWREDFKFAVQEANRLGLKVCVENCAGWSSSGGPWNTVTNAMQCLSSSERRVQGPAVFDAILPQPPVTLGFYRDIAALAFKDPGVQADIDAGFVPGGKLEIERAIYGADGGGSTDVKAKLIALLKSGRRSIVVNNDLAGNDPASGQVKQLHIEYTADGKPGTLWVDEGKTFIYSANPSQPFGISLLEDTFNRPPSEGTDDGGVIPHDGILDLTTNLGPDGRLHWDVPAGNWIIVRLGHTPVGTHNHPAPKGGEGLECDKFSQSALDAHWAGFMQKVLDDVGPLARTTLDSSLIDSYEIGGQDWTPNFREEFQKRRGYDPVTYLLTFTRRIVDSPEVTERFLWDMRRTFADLFAEKYYGHFTELCRQHGLKSDVEPYPSAGQGPYESLQSGGTVDTVMGEFWNGGPIDHSIKLASSVAHIYGKNICGAESYTAWNGNWQDDPYSLKMEGDLVFCQGVNRYFFHRYAMQPWINRWPGMAMGPFGINFERTVTWWKQGKAWIDYISRCEYLLQQGPSLVDAAYFDGQSAPVVTRVGKPPLPTGYDYDAVDADVLLHGATVKNGRITLASGASYAVLILPPDDMNMTPQMLQGIRELVRAGATTVGPHPPHSPSLADYPECDTQVKNIADELWGKCDGMTVKENSCGKGRIVWGESLGDVFAAQNLKPDFEFQSSLPGTHLAYIHRVAAEADIYFVSNQRQQFDTVECTFRVSGKLPELWHPDTGVIEPAPIWSAEAGRTKVHLDFEPAGSVFVIFRRAAGNEDHIVAVNDVFAGESATLKLKILHAIYGATDSGDGVDVTAKLSQLVQNGQLVVKVENDAFGGDPAVMHGKELRVDYTLDGQPGHVAMREGQALTLPTGAKISLPLPWKTSTAADGSPVVKAWGNGRIELRMASGRVLHASAADVPAPQEISGEWNLNFPPNWSAPASVTLGKLISWTDHPNDGVRYFSGTATYEKEIEISADQLSAGKDLWLDLGTVKNLAEVSLNGRDLGVLWKPPFRVNLTAAAKPGPNQLAVKVTNLWPNRLIGDEQLPPDGDRSGDAHRLTAWPQWLLDGKPSPTGRLTLATWRQYDPNSPLLVSGLLGPVMLRTAEIIPAKE